MSSCMTNENSCPQKALIEQTLSFDYTVLLIDGDYVKTIDSTRTKHVHSVKVVLGSKGIPKGKS